MAEPSIALVTCVHDEEIALPAFLAYHAGLGVERAYVFLDRCQDGSLEAAGSNPIGVPIVASRDPRHRQLVDYKNQCASEALARATSEGIDWVVHLDVDEYAWGQPPERLGSLDHGVDPLATGDLRAMVERADRTTSLVGLATLEAVPELGARDVATLEHFQSPDRPVPRRLLDPRSGKRIVAQRLLGHDHPKWAIRTAADLRPTSAHGWETAEGAEPVSERLGTHFHFPATSARQWRAKYAKAAFEPARGPGGEPVPFPKQAWKQAAPRMTATEAAEYYTRWVAMAPTEVHDLVERGQIRTLGHVQAVLRAVGFSV